MPLELGGTLVLSYKILQKESPAAGLFVINYHQLSSPNDEILHVNRGP